MRSIWILAAFGVGVIAASLLGPKPVSAAAGPADFSSVISRVDAGVVHITTVMRGGARARSRDDNVGSGFVIDQSGLIVTNRHVVNGAQRVRVTVQGHTTVDAKIVGVDPATDLALLQVPLQGLQPLSFGDPRNLRVGQWVLASGSPYQLSHSWSVGIVSGLGRRGVGVNPRGVEDYIQTDAAANLGNSGGPLFNADGQVVGVVTAVLSRATGHQGITFAVPADIAQQTINRMRGGTTAAPRPSLGVRVREIRVGLKGGLRITRFDAGSTGQRAGLRVNDVIVAVGSSPVARASDLQRLVWGASAQGSIAVVFVREGRTLQLNVPLR